MRRLRFYSFITLAFACFLCASCGKNEFSEATATSLSNEQIAENIAKADELARGNNNVEKLREAVSLLAQCRNFDNPNFEVEWKFARYNYFLGKRSTNEAESEKAFKAGENAGKLAMRIQPEKPEGYFWYAANLGEQAKRAPLTKGLSSVDDIRAAMNKVIEIQPDFQGGSAFDALGQIELQTRLTGGKAEKAVEYLEKGLEFGKDNSYIRLHLAQAYLAVKRNADAKKQLDFLLKMNPHPDYSAEHEESVKEAKKLLETRF